MRLSDIEYKEENMKIIEKILKNNNYPKSFYNRILRKPEENRSTRIAVGDNDNNNIRCRFPNIPVLARKMQSLFKDNLKMVTYNPKTTSELFTRIKDKEPEVNKSGLIYEIPCNDCQLVYIGQTRQKLKARVRQHELDCRYYNEQQCTALSEHHFDLDHSFKFTETRILDTEPNHFKRNVSEMIQILLNRERAVNHRTDTNNLSDIYINVLKKYQRDHPPKDQRT